VNRLPAGADVQHVLVCMGIKWHKSRHFEQICPKKGEKQGKTIIVILWSLVFMVGVLVFVLGLRSERPPILLPSLSLAYYLKESQAH
jgi:hypothetical protein